MGIWGGHAQQAKHRELIERFTGWVYTCVSKNASVVASVPLKAFGHDEELDAAHPLAQVLEEPNPEDTMFDIIENVQMSLDLQGNAYLLMERDTLGTPYALWPLLTQHVKLEISKEKGVVGYRYGRWNSDFIVLPASEVIHIKMPNPHNIYYGLGPLEAASLTADRLRLMAEQQLSFYSNNCRPDMLIKTPFGPDSPEYTRFMEQFKEKFRRQTGKPMMAPPGIEIEPIGYPPKDMMEHLIAKMTREELCNVFGVPMTLLEVTKSRAEAEAGLYQYMLHTIQPRCGRIARALNKQLSVIFDPSIKLKFDDPVPQNRKMRMKEIDYHLKSGYSTVDEEREKDGLPPLTKEKEDD